MTTALVGYTGFVGTSIRLGREVPHLINRANIHEQRGRHFDLLLIAAGDARKWYANANPDEDRQHIDALIEALSGITAERVVQLSTVDVLNTKSGDEATAIDLTRCDTYGGNRFRLEQFVRQHFVGASIVRLPGLFGAGLKKNIIFDVMQGRSLQGFNPSSTFQWFDMGLINTVIDRVLQSRVPLLHVCAEPLSAGELAEALHGQRDTMLDTAPLVQYDVRSVHATAITGQEGAYLYTRAQMLDRIATFVREAPCV